jgi:DsbC/DsbD-like thiol-disulfide interchange protein
MNCRIKFAMGGLLLSAVLMLRAVPPMSAAVRNPHLTVELRSRDSALASNQDVTLGVYFKLETGWHIYWQNPGDSGEPPTITWHLPPEVTASSMQFPAPKQIRIGSLMGEVCIPGRQVVSIDLPAATAVARVAANAGLFSEAQERLPRPLPATARASIVSAKGRFLIRLWLGHSASWAVFFPFDANQIDNAAAQQVQPLADGVQIIVKKDENLLREPAQIRGLVELGGGRVYDVTAAVASAVDGELTGSPP